MTRTCFRALIGAIALLAATLTPQAFGVIAYNVPNGTAGNQAYGGTLGMDFDTNHAIVVTRLGVFDDGSNGMNATITGQIFDRATTASLASLSFDNGSPGTLVAGSRFKSLGSPLILPFGFQGVSAAGGYDGAELNGNSGAPVWTTDTGGGLISFVGGGRYNPNGGDPIGFPTNGDGGPANRYAAGTFEFAPANIAYEIASGVVGNQAFGGALGMDFNINQPTRITELGVFDSGSNGLSLTITAHVYDRNNPGAPLATLVFDPQNPGTLIGGSRFKLLNNPLVLMPGFQGTIVAEGYGDTEPNGNSIGGHTTYDGGGRLTFVGPSRYGFTPGLYPTNLDAGPADQYLAGTFRFEAFIPIPEPATVGLLLMGAAGLLRRRRQNA